MITKISENIFEWMGWCPNAPAMRATPTVLMVPPKTIQSAQPSGGAGGSGRFNRGIGVALSGTKTLFRNRQLLWFSLLTGVVMAFMFIAQYVLYLLGPFMYNTIGFPHWLILIFVIELVTVFCLNVLLAGLVMSTSPEEGRTVSFRQGLFRTKQYLSPLADWSVIVAFLGTGLFISTLYFGYIQIIMALYPLFHQFPFGFILLPEYYHIGPIAGTFAIQNGLTYTLILSGINLLLVFLTLFVVPLLVLEKKRLPEAIAGSAALMKKVWGEAIVCFLILGVMLFAVSLTSFLFGIIYGFVAPEMQLFWYPGDAWIASAVLFMLIVFGLAVVVSTIAGIAVGNLYMFGKSGRIPAIPRGNTQDPDPVR
jgi:MFS family permease